MVSRVALLEGPSQARLVLVAAGTRGHECWRPGRRADQLGVVLLRPGVGAGPIQRRVLPAPVLPQAARPQLGEPRGPPGDLPDDGLVAGPWDRRGPHGWNEQDLQG